jgi:branched-chain amino acid transport system ATP-binding protein
MAMLEVRNLGIQFGGLRAVDDFNITIEKGALYGLIGPNGAGKTTAFNLLTGVYKPNEGIIKLDGEDITGKKTIDINCAGIARTFQNIRLFKELSVLDNVKVGLHNQFSYSTLAGILRLPSYFKVEKEMDEKALELLKVFDLDGEKMAGKTGSAQVRRISLRERQTGIIKQADLPWKYRDHALFVAYAPYDNPKYAVAVLVEHGGSGAKVAAPIASNILLEALKLDKTSEPVD